MNWAQQELFDTLHNCEIVLKCRQIGITTFFAILLLDQVLWNDNLSAGIIAQTIEDTKGIFQDKLKYAFDHLHPALRPIFKVVGDSARELAFAHGSVIRVGTSLRGSTLQWLHISEFGKICAKDPEKAREIMTGSLQTVHAGQHIFIESTAEGKEGYFFELCKAALQHAQSGKPFGPLDFKPRFFPWNRHPSYQLDQPIVLSEHLQEYFSKLSLEGFELSLSQKYWYAKKYELLKEDTLREFPTTPDEAFQASQDGYWYAKQMKELYDLGHIDRVSYDKAIPVHTAWDLGQADFMSIWFFQINRQGEINVIDYFEKRDCPIDQIASILKAKTYAYGEHLWPHDANARDRAGITFVKQAREFGLSGIVLEQHELRDGINLVRATLSRCWFDAKACHKGIIALENYKKRWSSVIGGFSSEPAHDDASHGADAFRYLCSGLEKLRAQGGTLDNDLKALRAFWGG